MTRMTTLLAAASIVALAACETPAPEADTMTADAAETAAAAEAEAAEAMEVADAAMEKAEDAMAEADAMMEKAEAAVEEMTDEAKLAKVLAAQPEDVQARYDARNPAETLAFFGIEPGMTVAEGLPGGGWYTKILLGYVGSEGKVVGAHYPDGIWAKFRPDDEEWQASRVEATANWPVQAAEWEVTDAAAIGSYTMTQMPEEMKGSADAVLFIRALHNLHRFNADTGWFEATLTETFELVKPGGIVGVVQHSGPEENADEWADGSAGYLKQSRVVSAFEAAGFVLEEASDVNANPADQPSNEDIVWRLPPSTATT